MEETTKKANNAQVADVADSELTDVTGGRSKAYDKESGKYYWWTGIFDNNLKYLCPNCRRPLSSLWGLKYSCDRCNESWVLEYRLIPNLASGKWTEVSKDVYDGTDYTR